MHPFLIGNGLLSQTKTSCLQGNLSEEGTLSYFFLTAPLYSQPKAAFAGFFLISKSYRQKKEEDS